MVNHTYSTVIPIINLQRLWASKKKKPTAFVISKAMNPFNGADNRIRTGDLFLTKEVLYLLSYISISGGTTNILYMISWGIARVFLEKNLPSRLCLSCGLACIFDLLPQRRGFDAKMDECVPCPKTGKAFAIRIFRLLMLIQKLIHLLLKRPFPSAPSDAQLPAMFALWAAHNA